MHSINYLELLAVCFALKAFAKSIRNYEILLRIDNTTAISYVNRMGDSRHVKYNELDTLIWKWAEERRLWLFASYVTNSENIDADWQSRIMNIDTEWKLASYAYKKINIMFGSAQIVLFASRINSKCKIYCSWFKDPNAVAVDAFTLSWENLNFYAFPPFSMITKVLQKIINEKAIGIVVVPCWTAQSWFPIFLNLLVQNPLVFKANKKLLLSPCRTLIHPLADRLTLLAGLLSGNHLREKM